MPHQISPWHPRWVAVFALCLALACNRTETLNPVHGKVLYQGTPLAGAVVSFHPQGERADERDRSIGRANDDGTFSLTTGPTVGAPPGDYVVTVICPVPVENKTGGMSMGGMPETQDRLRGAYANAQSSKLKVTIKEGVNQLEPFELE